LQNKKNYGLVHVGLLLNKKTYGLVHVGLLLNLCCNFLICLFFNNSQIFLQVCQFLSDLDV